MQTYTHRYSITAENMNKSYRLTPSAVLLYYQDCWARMLSLHHLAAFDLIKEQKMWVITEFTVHFTDTETYWSEEVEVTVWNSELTPLRLYSDFQVTKALTGEVVATGCTCWNLLNTATKRIERTDALRDKLTIRPVWTVESHKKLRMPTEGELKMEVTHQVNRLDLDFNGHVNNRSYLSLALLTASDDFLNTHAPTEMHIHWLHETFLDETLTCHLLVPPDAPVMPQSEATPYLHQLYKSDGTCVAQIYSRWRTTPHPADVAQVLVRQ